MAKAIKGKSKGKKEKAKMPETRPETQVAPRELELPFSFCLSVFAFWFLICRLSKANQRAKSKRQK
jgi:hypothetical protein